MKLQLALLHAQMIHTHFSMYTKDMDEAAFQNTLREMKDTVSAISKLCLNHRTFTVDIVIDILFSNRVK